MGLGLVSWWGVTTVLGFIAKAVATGLCFGTGFWLKDQIISYIRDRKSEIETNLATGVPWYHSARRQLRREFWDNIPARNEHSGVAC